MPQTVPFQEQRGLRYACTTILLAWLAAFGPLCTDMYLPTLPEIALDLRISTALTQASITACLLGLAIGQIILGPISDGKGRRPVLILSLLLFTAASFLCTLATSGTSLLFFRFLQGLGGAGGTVLSRAICCDVYQGSRLTQYMAMLMAINSIAPILGPVCGGFLGGQFGWQSVFFALGVIGVGLTLSCRAIIPETLPADRRIEGGVMASFANMLTLFGQKTFLCYAGVQGFTMGGFFAYISASPFIFQNMYGFSVEAYSIVFGCNAIGILVFSLLAGALSRRFGDRALLFAGDALRTIACLAVLAVAVWHPVSPWPMIFVLFAMVVLQGLTLSTSFSLAICSQTTGAGAASGVLGVAVFLFGALASPLAGLAGPESALPLGIIAALTGTCSLVLTVLGNRLHVGGLGYRP